MGGVKYRYEITLTNVQKPSSNIDNEWITFRLRTDEFQIYHFYQWQFFPDWDADTVILDKNNLNQRNSSIKEINERIFIGSEPIFVGIKLMPVFYENYRTSQDSIFSKPNRVEKQYMPFYDGTTYGSSRKTKNEFLDDPNAKGFTIKFLIGQQNGFFRYFYVPYLGGLEVLSCIAFVSCISIFLVRIIKSQIIGNSDRPLLPKNLSEEDESKRDL